MNNDSSLELTCQLAEVRNSVILLYKEHTNLVRYLNDLENNLKTIIVKTVKDLGELTDLLEHKILKLSEENKKLERALAFERSVIKTKCVFPEWI